MIRRLPLHMNLIKLSLPILLANRHFSIFKKWNIKIFIIYSRAGEFTIILFTFLKGSHSIIVTE